MFLRRMPFLTLSIYPGQLKSKTECLTKETGCASFTAVLSLSATLTYLP